MRLYRCADSGIMLEEINNYDDDIEISFLTISNLIPKENEEGKNEKHIPIFTRKGDEVCVKIGSTPHPMTNEHYIEYVELETNKGTYRKKLDKDPTVCFKVDKDEEILNIYSYCNIHGLWVCKGKEEQHETL